MSAFPRLKMHRGVRRKICRRTTLCFAAAKKTGSKDREAVLAYRTLFQQALELHPTYAAARAHLGRTCIAHNLPFNNRLAVDADLERGLSEARQAIRLDPNLAIGYQVLSFGLAAKATIPVHGRRHNAQSHSTQMTPTALWLSPRHRCGSVNIRRLSPMQKPHGAYILWHRIITPMSTDRHYTRRVVWMMRIR